jgi:hypothetical protein
MSRHIPDAPRSTTFRRATRFMARAALRSTGRRSQHVLAALVTARDLCV